ncbi:hypothetical protein OG252_16270 [Streptomyces sp. NBC_01352]|uniref:hypothetical protein n=1 Tax=Streptomyces sp. NBC_01352 TaxID=2903834 RepID=UPI002E36C299|nr:hypothetical protein [Streptomyces sp. NBC_01352]
MPAPATRPRRLALALVAITAVTLGTISASTAAASDTSAATDDPPRGRPNRPGHAVGYEPTENAPDDVNEANDDFAACMRGEGQTFYPDFHAEKGDDGSVRLRVTLKGDRADMTDVAGKEYREAIKKCAPVLEDAGITFPSAPDLPKHPGRPGKGELPELRKHFKSGDELPSLTRSA